MDENNKIDKETTRHLSDLKSKVKKIIPKTNLHELKVKECLLKAEVPNKVFILIIKVNLDPKNGISKETHRNYLEKFGSLFYNSVKELIDRNAKKLHFLDNYKIKDKQLIQEVLDHANFCKSIVEKFHGRNDLIEEVIKNI